MLPDKLEPKPNDRGKVESLKRIQDGHKSRMFVLGLVSLQQQDEISMLFTWGINCPPITDQCEASYWSSITQQPVSSPPLRFLKYGCPFHIHHPHLWQRRAVEESCRKELSWEVQGSKLLIIHARVRDTEWPADVVIDLASTGRKGTGVSDGGICDF